MPSVRDASVRNMFFRKFNRGLRGWGKWTGDDYVALIQQVLFVVGTGAQIIPSYNIRKDFISVCFKVQRMFIIMKRDEVNEEDLNQLMDLAKDIGPLFDSVQSALPVEMEENLNRPKVHAPLHFRYLLL